MDKTTCFSGFRDKHRRKPSDCESLARDEDEVLEDAEEEDDEYDLDEEEVECGHSVETLTEDTGLEEDEDGVPVIITIKNRYQSLRAVVLSGHAYLCVYVALVLLFLGAAVSLVLVCLQIVHPYLSVLNYKRSSCYTVETRHNGIRGCMCGIGCNNKYTCIVITVKYLDSSLNNTWVNTTMYEDESLISAQCSFFPPCRSSQARIDITMAKYTKEYGRIGKHHTCYHSVERHKQHVIRTHRFHKYHVIHGLLWSSLAIVTSVGVFLFILKRKKCTIV